MVISEVVTFQTIPQTAESRKRIRERRTRRKGLREEGRVLSGGPGTKMCRAATPDRPALPPVWFPRASQWAFHVPVGRPASVTLRICNITQGLTGVKRKRGLTQIFFPCRPPPRRSTGHPRPARTIPPMTNTLRADDYKVADLK